MLFIIITAFSVFIHYVVLYTTKFANIPYNLDIHISSAICICAFLKLDVSMGIGTVFGIYCAGNVSAKFAHKENGYARKRRRKTN